LLRLLVRRLTGPRGAHPVPELPALLALDPDDPDDADELDSILALSTATDHTGTEEAVRLQTRMARGEARMTQQLADLSVTQAEVEDCLERHTMGCRSSARLRQPGHGPDEIDHPTPDHPTPGATRPR
jgi:hypothetical protein